MQFWNPLNLINVFWIVVAFLATARITNILHHEEIAVPIRKLIGIEHARLMNYENPSLPSYPEPVSYPENFIGSLWMCFKCLSIWVSMVTILITVVFPYLLLPFAVSQGAIILDAIGEQNNE